MKFSLNIPFDAYERNKKVASLIPKNKKILDVGGGVTGIRLFTNNKVKIVDLDVGDIKMDIRKLSLPANSFDVVVFVDVLEHIPVKDRKKVIQKLIKIAKEKVIISAPYGSKEHIDAEKSLLNAIKKKSKEVPFLEEHVKYKLPRPQDIMPKNSHKVSVFYSGDFRVSNKLLLFHLFELTNPYLNKILYYGKVSLNILLNFLFYPVWFYKNERKFANRFYVVIDK